MSFFRRRTFWERLTGKERTPIEKFENGLSNLFGFVVIFVVVIGFIVIEFFPILAPAFEILEIILGIISFIF